MKSSHNHKPCSRGEMHPELSLEVSATSSSPSNSGLGGPGNFQLTPHSVDLKSPASLPGRRVKCEKRTTKSLNSLNSSMISLLEDADTFRTDQDQGNHRQRRTKSSDRRLMAQKRQEIIHIQRLLTNQQEIYINLYAQIKDLEAKCGLDLGKCLGEMRVLTMKGWPPHDLLLLVSEQPPDKQDASGALESALMEQLKAELSTITIKVMDLAADLTARRTKVLEYMRKRLPETKSKNDFDLETEIIREVISDTARLLEAKINRSVELAKTAWRDRDSLLKKIDCLNTELYALQSKFNKQNGSKRKELEKLHNEQIKKSDSRSTTDLKDKLNKERTAREALKHTVTTAENMLRSARARITQLERELKLTQKELQTSMRKYKEYVTLHRNRANTFDVRSKKLLEESKTGEVTIEMLSLQRDALEFRVKELQEQNKTVIENNEAQQAELQARLQRLQEKAEEQVQETFKKMADARAMELENQIKDMQDQCRVLREQSKQLVQIQSEKCLDYLPHKEDEPSKRELELWSDLQLTKNNLARVMEELKQSREDKESLLNSLAKIAQEGSDQNMAKELLHREQKNFKLQQVIKEQKENIKSMMDTIAQKDNQLVYLKLENARINYECNSKDSPKQELALEVIDLNSQVAKLTRERESLKNDAMKRSLMLERYERSSELFAQVTRARRNLAAQLEGGRCSDRPRSGAVEANAHLSSSLSSSYLEAVKTWEELRTDRERVMQLQEVVAAQNIQLQRDCRIRNQLEQRRAVMERLLLNQNHTATDQFNPAENAAAYFGPSSYFVNNA